MIELPEIDEQIFKMFGNTDLIESCLDEPGYRWSRVAVSFILSLSMEKQRALPQDRQKTVNQKMDAACERKVRVFPTPWGYLRQHSIVADKK